MGQRPKVDADLREAVSRALCARAQNETRRGKPPLLVRLLSVPISRQFVTKVPMRFGAWPTGMTAICFMAWVSIAVTAFIAAFDTYICLLSGVNVTQFGTEAIGERPVTRS